MRCPFIYFRQSSARTPVRATTYGENGRPNTHEVCVGSQTRHVSIITCAAGEMEGECRSNSPWRCCQRPRTPLPRMRPSSFSCFLRSISCPCGSARPLSTPSSSTTKQNSCRRCQSRSGFRHTTFPGRRWPAWWTSTVWPRSAAIVQISDGGKGREAEPRSPRWSKTSPNSVGRQPCIARTSKRWPRWKMAKLLEDEN